MKKAVSILVIMAALIYGLQLVIFHTPETTAFYILQDLAFLPISIAVATLVVGQVLSDREKKERVSKTRMLTSNFFTEMGTELMFLLLRTPGDNHELRELFLQSEVTDAKSLASLQAKVRQMPCRVVLDEETYVRITELILGARDRLLMISSNSMLLEHENFTELLWAIFHLLDEFRLRGSYAQMEPETIEHLEHDLARVLQLLLVNWAANVLYTKKYYPNYYNAALAKLSVAAAKGRGKEENGNG